MIRRKKLTPGVLESICNILGETKEGLSGENIHRLLLKASIDDIAYNELGLAKRKKLLKAVENEQKKNNCSNNILHFIQLAMEPSLYVNKDDLFNDRLNRINQQLAFIGYELLRNGNYREITAASTIEDVTIKVDDLKKELEKRKTHSEIFKYCKAELLVNNYFHAVFEANKGLFQRIRDLSGLSKDGSNLIEETFSKNPILIINNYITQPEKDEHDGFCLLLKGLCGMFRNTTSHKPKIDWPIEEQDALDILCIISYCHRRLDKAQKIR